MEVAPTLAALRAEWDDPPERFRDPIMLTLIDEPMVISSGHTFDKSTLIDSQGNFRFERCPMTRELIEPRAYPLVYLKREILEFKLLRFDSVLRAAELVAEREPVLQLLSFGRELLNSIGGFRYPAQATAYWTMRFKICLDDADALCAAIQELVPDVSSVASTPANALFDEQATRLMDLVSQIAKGGDSSTAAALVVRCIGAIPCTAGSASARPIWAAGWVALVRSCFGGTDDMLHALPDSVRELLSEGLAKLCRSASLPYWETRLALCFTEESQLQLLAELSSKLRIWRQGDVERVIVSGAGVSVANGEYIRDGEYDHAPLFKNGQWWLLRYQLHSGLKRWYIADREQLSVNDGDLYYVDFPGDLPPCRLRWLKAKDGKSPIPSFTAVRTNPVETEQLTLLIEKYKGTLASTGLDVSALERSLRVPRGQVAAIEGRRGWYVDQVAFRMRSGVVLTYGANGGGEVQPFLLEEGETIVMTTQHYSGQYLGSRIEFTTSTGRTFAIEGSKHEEERGAQSSPDHKSRQVQDGEEITALNFSGGSRGCHLTGVRINTTHEGDEWEAVDEAFQDDSTDSDYEDEGEEDDESALEGEEEDEEEGDEDDDDDVDLETTVSGSGAQLDEELQLQLALALSMSEQ